MSVYRQISQFLYNTAYLKVNRNELKLKNPKNVYIKILFLSTLSLNFPRAIMSWRSSGSTNDELIQNLKGNYFNSNKGLVLLTNLKAHILSNSFLYTFYLFRSRNIE